MLLRERLEHDGQRLFRLRSYLPIVLVLVVVMHLLGGRPEFARHPGWTSLCLAAGLIGLLIRLMVAGRIPAGSSGRNTQSQIAETLNTTGWYSLVRHPLYLGNFFIWLGIAMIPASAMLLTIVVLVFWLYHERIMYAEEEFLRSRFRSVYHEWGARTPAFVPRLAVYRPAALVFSPRAAIRREYTSAIAFATVFLLLRTVASEVDSGATARRGSGVALAIIAFVYLLLTLVKRRTAWLDVEGR